MSFLAKIACCNQFNPQDAYPFFVGDQQIGWIKRGHETALREFSNYFTFPKECIRLHSQLSTYEAKTDALAEVVGVLKQRGMLSNWRGEIYEIAQSREAPPLFALERGATAFFGVPAYGTHLNGFTYYSGELYIWIAQRSKHLKVAPGQLDNISAGGLPKGLTPLKNIIKEGWEEAQLPTSLTRDAIPCGEISYLLNTSNGIVLDTMICYDLELHPDIIPKTDGAEVESFSCLPAKSVYDLIKNTDKFKYNSALVIIDFLIRKNIIMPNEPDYSKLKEFLCHPFFQERYLPPYDS